MLPNATFSSSERPVVNQVPFAAHQDVLEAHVTVDDLHRLAVGTELRVRVLQARQDLGDDMKRGLHRHSLAPPTKALVQHAQRDTRDVLHRDEVRSVDQPEIEHLTDVAVDQLGSQVGLIDQHVDGLSFKGSPKCAFADDLAVEGGVGLLPPDAVPPQDAKAEPPPPEA
jgi:hypothetical protein